ncbi:UbiA family prenyltransferase, partial [Acinetobacter baumannii]
ALGLVASASYIINDLWDLPEDRKHWSKRLRPLASGEISIRLAGRLSAGALATGRGLGLYLGPLALTVRLLYLAITLSYSFGRK